MDVVECDKMAVNRTPVALETEYSSCHTKAFAAQKLLSMTNVIITPHIAYNTKESAEVLLNTTFNNIKDYSKGLHTNQLRL